MIAARKRTRLGTRSINFALLASALIPITPAFSQHGLDNLVATGTMTGRCQRLIVRGRDVSSQCNGRLGNTTHSDGRSGFAFFQGRSFVISFAGQDHPAVGNHATLNVDMVLIADGRMGPSARPQVIRARGSCTYTNPYIGVSTVICTARTRQGAFRATFRSDGRPPEVQRFQH